MYERQRAVPEKGLSHQPEQHGRVLSHGPEHRDGRNSVRFAQDLNRPVFQFIKLRHQTSPAFL